MEKVSSILLLTAVGQGELVIHPLRYNSLTANFHFHSLPCELLQGCLDRVNLDRAAFASNLCIL